MTKTGLWLIVLAFSGMALTGCGDSTTPAARTPDSSSVLTSELTVTEVRPEAFSWFWNNLREDLLMQANPDIRSFRWLVAPTAAEHLGYSAGAQYQLTVTQDGQGHVITVTYLDPASVRTRVSSDNFLGERPYNFIAQQVQIDQEPGFIALLRYLPTGDKFKDSDFAIEVTPSGDAAIAALYVTYLRKTLSGTQGFLTRAFDEEYLKAVFYTRGSYTVTPVDPGSASFRVLITQNIQGITPDMLAWWWDHIETPERYRLWQPVDHDGFDYAVTPTMPDLKYDVGARQIIREYIGSSLVTLAVEGADPTEEPAPPIPIVQPDPNYFYSLTSLEGIQEYNGISIPLDVSVGGLLPPNQLVHQWSWNSSRDGVTLDTTFTLPAIVLVIQPSFGDDLGHHALREFQMMPYFLPRLFKREWLGK